MTTEITLPESAALDAIAPVAAQLAAAAVDITDWTTLIAVDTADASAATRHYMTAAATSAEAGARRGMTLADVVAEAGPVVKSTTPHPFVVGAAKTNSVVDYRTLVMAAAAAAELVAAVAAARRAPPKSKFKDAAVVRRFAGARQCIRAAGTWHYDESIRPQVMTEAVAAAADIAFVCGLVQQGAAATPRDNTTTNALYGAVALLAAITTPSMPGAAPVLHRWAATTATAMRVEAASELRDPRPPASHMKATDAQILLEAHSGTLPPKAATRLRLAVALNGYISANETPETIAAVTAEPTASVLTTHILDVAANAVAARWKSAANARDDITPYRPFMVVHT
jgi:hypothetical protein